MKIEIDITLSFQSERGLQRFLSSKMIDDVALKAIRDKQLAVENYESMPFIEEELGKRHSALAANEKGGKGE